MKRLLPLVLIALPLIIIPQVRAADEANEQTLQAEATIERETEDTGFLLKPAIFLAAMQPKELNEFLTAVPNGEKLSGKLGAAAGFTIDAGYEINRNFAMGTRLEYFLSGVKRSYTFHNYTYSDEVELSGFIPYLTASAQTEIVPRFLLGLSVGIGAPIFYHFDYSYKASNGKSSSSGGATYSATPVAAYTALTAAIAVSRRVTIATEVGYKMLNAARMNANSAGREDLKNNINAGDVLKNDGKDIRADASAPYLSVGVTITI